MRGGIGGALPRYASSVSGGPTPALDIAATVNVHGPPWEMFTCVDSCPLDCTVICDTGIVSSMDTDPAGPVAVTTYEVIAPTENGSFHPSVTRPPPAGFRAASLIVALRPVTPNGIEGLMAGAVVTIADAPATYCSVGLAAATTRLPVLAPLAKVSGTETTVVPGASERSHW